MLCPGLNTVTIRAGEGPAIYHTVYVMDSPNQVSCCS